MLLQPGESAVLEFFLPHRPISAERAVALARQWLSYEADKPALPESAWATDESMNVPDIKR